jgi:DNA repair protein RadD
VCPPTDIPDAPGLAFPALLRTAKESSLRQLVGSSIVETLEGLDPTLLSAGRLGELAAGLIEPSEAIRNETSRNLILRMLPLPKARELANRLGLQDVGRDIYDRLCSIAGSRERLRELFSFFGVVEDARAPMDWAPDSEQARAGYALFDHQRSVARRALKVLAEPPPYADRRR